MFRTILFFIYFWTFLVLSLFIFSIYKIFTFIFIKSKKQILLILVQWWAKNILRIGGVKIRLTGAENIPKNSNVCFVCNHQSNYDIACVIVSIPMIIGFIAKKELKKYLPLRVWMDEIMCSFIDRKKPKESIKKVESRIAAIKDGNALLLFPEGSRSKAKELQDFKTGSLKLLVENNITLVPISIKNSYLRYEKNKRISPGMIDMVIHNSIDTKGKEPDLIITKVKAAIKSNLYD